MTEQAVTISITVNAFDDVLYFDREIPVLDLEAGIGQVLHEVGCQVLVTSIAGLDQKLRQVVPAEWQNVGTEKRSVLTSLGWLQYRRRVYRDEAGKRRKPIDELLGVERYARDSHWVRQMGAWLACEGTYRQAAELLSWLIRTHVSHSTVNRMAWQVGNRIADGEKAELARIFGSGAACAKGTVGYPKLFGESDGVWVHLQREKRRSAEVRVATLYSGKQRIGKQRHRLVNKCSVAAIDLKGEAWQEHVLRVAHSFYDLEQTQLLITGGDGNQWVRNSFNRFAIKQEFILDRFHLARAARRALGSKMEARELVEKLRQKGFAAVCDQLTHLIDRADGQDREKLVAFYQYIDNHQDGLLDLEQRDSAYEPVSLGAIEGNVDKLVVHRMKGRGCCWRLRGARAMLALCQHKEALKNLAVHYLPLEEPGRPRRQKRAKPDQSAWLYTRMPIFYGPDQQKPWVREWYRYIHND